MEIAGEYRIKATQQAVWDALNDPKMLQMSLPGCKSLEQTGANEFTGAIAARIGPVSATFKGKVELSDLDPPNGYTLSGRGQGGPAGFAKGSAKVTLEPVGYETLLRYRVEVDIGGKLASVGGRLIGGVATSMAEDFFGKFGRAVAGDAGDVDAEIAPHPTEVTSQPVARAAGHIPIIDRVAWLVAGFCAGIVATLRFVGHL
jgi:carbon monoxide dehydrogenase subunit G